MGELMTVGGRRPLEDRRIFVLYPNPVAAVDIAGRLEEAGAEALPIFDLRQLSWGFSGDRSATSDRGRAFTGLI
jgi:hypothetical protein